MVAELRGRNPDARAVYMSGFTRSIPAAVSPELACPFLPKPFSSDELLDTLERLGVTVFYDDASPDDLGTDDHGSDGTGEVIVDGETQPARSFADAHARQLLDPPPPQGSIRIVGDTP